MRRHGRYVAGLRSGKRADQAIDAAAVARVGQVDTPQLVRGIGYAFDGVQVAVVIGDAIDAIGANAAEVCAVNATS